MGKHIIFMILFSASEATALCQDATNSNPILFTEMIIGHSWGKAGSFSGGATINYQNNRHLFTIRYLGTTKIHSEIISPFLSLPVFDEKKQRL